MFEKDVSNVSLHHVLSCRTVLYINPCQTNVFRTVHPHNARQQGFTQCFIDFAFLVLLLYYVYPSLCPPRRRSPNPLLLLFICTTLLLKQLSLCATMFLLFPHPPDVVLPHTPDMVSLVYTENSSPILCSEALFRIEVIIISLIRGHNAVTIDKQVSC